MTKEKAIEILNKVLDYSGLGRKEFSVKIGIENPQWIADILNPKKNVYISREKMARICEAYPEINIEYLATGNGEFITKKPVEQETVNISETKKSDYRLVPLINIDSVGGLYSENITTPSEQYILRMMPFTEAKEGDVAILQSGTSMYPTIPPGSALLIREVTEWREYFGYGGIFVLWLRDGRRITKEVRRYDPDPKNYVWCVSYNPEVADEELPKSMIRGVWKVVKYVADFGW